MRCLSCKYDLSKLTEHRCPECGRAFNPNDISTFDWRHELPATLRPPNATTTKLRYWLGVAFIACCITFFLVLVFLPFLMSKF